MALTTAGVGIQLVDQLAHRMFAIADHVRWVAACRSHQAVAHHEQSEVVSRQVSLNHHLTVVCRSLVAQLQLLPAGDVDSHPFALVAVLRLHHYWQANVIGGTPGIFYVGHRTAHGDRHTSRVQQLLGQVLVLCDGFRNSTGGVQLGCLDTALPRAPAKLHQAPLCQASPGNVACGGCLHDGAGAWAQAFTFVGVPQCFDSGMDVERAVVQCGLHQ